MIEATISDLAFPNGSSKEPDGVRRRGCVEHTFGKEVGQVLTPGIIPVTSEQACTVPQLQRRGKTK